MIQNWILTILSLSCFMLYGGPSEAEGFNFVSVEMEEALHFVAPDGSAQLVPPAAYRVEQETGPALRLTSADRKEVFVIAATSTQHEEALRFPIALLVADEEDNPHIVLLLPDGKRIEAHGSRTEVSSRGLLAKPLSSGTVSAVSKIITQLPAPVTASPPTPSQAATAGPPLADRTRIPLPQDLGCPKDDSSYFVGYQRVYTSGLLDKGMLINHIQGTAHVVQTIMDDLKARIIGISCEQTKSNAQLDRMNQAATVAQSLRLPASALGDCVKGTAPAPYTLWTGRWSQGGIDVGRILDTITGALHNGSMKVLNDIQARIEQLHCNATRIAMKVDYYASNKAHTTLQKIAGRPCPRATPKPTYVVSHGDANITGLADLSRVATMLNRAFMNVERSLDDLQIRLREVRCNQQNTKIALEAILDPRVNAPLERTRVPSLLDQQVVSASPQAPTIKATPDAFPKAALLQDQLCSGLRPNPSYVRAHPRWAGAANDVDGPRLAWISDLNGLGSLDLENAANDLQVRLEGLRCEQQNIVARLNYIGQQQ